MSVPPLHERKQHESEFATLFSQPVFKALGPFAVADTLDDFVVNQAVESICEHVACDAEAFVQLIETAQSENEVTHDQQRPSITHELERTSDRADLTFVGTFQHVPSLALVSCMTQVGSCRVACLKQVTTHPAF